MKHQTIDSFYKKHPSFKIVHNLFNSNKMTDGHIITENYDIFKNKDIIKILDEFFIHDLSDLQSLKSITIIQRISRDSCLEDFNTIYQNLLKNTDNILHFRYKFNIEVCIDIHVKAFDLQKAIDISNFVINNDIGYINFTFDFPPLNKNLAFSLISNIKKFCVNPIIKNTKIRFVDFPFCFIPAAKYKCVYRRIVNTLKGEIFLQRETINKLKREKFAYFKPCKICRCKIPCYAYTNIRQFPEYKPFLSAKTQNTVVFVGGSMRETEYYADEDIIYTAPAEQSDMFMTILEGFENIIIIDGYFYSRFPCTTFEVMLALENGINVFGSSSIGALRAIELDNYGMIGIGYVYEYLKKQYIKPYHIVAQTYNEHDKPLSIPLVNIIYFLECALSKGIIIKDEFDDCLSAADNIHFTLLSFKYFFRELRSKKKLSLDIISRLKNYFSFKSEEFFNIKRKMRYCCLMNLKAYLKIEARIISKRYLIKRSKNI